MSPEDKTSPLPQTVTPAEAQQTLALLPRVRRLVTSLAVVYEVGQDYPPPPDVPGCKPVDGTIRRILEAPSESNDSGRIFLVRVEPKAGSGFDGVVWRDRVSGDFIAEKTEEVLAEYGEGYERAEEADPEVGIDVRRVIQPLGPVALVYEVDLPAPVLPAPHQAIRGKVSRIVRTSEGPYRVRVEPPAGDPLIGRQGYYWITLYRAHSGLELLAADEADREEAAALDAALREIEEAAKDGDGDGGDDTSGDGS